MSKRQPTNVVGALSAVVLLGTAACRSPDHSKAQSTPAVLRLGISVGEMAAASPQNGVRQITQNLTVEQLVRTGEDGRPTPWLAQSWEFTADGRTLKIHLRPDVKFHDGSPVTASSIATSLQRALRDTMGPAFEDVESIKASGEADLDIALRKHSPFVLEALDIQLRSPGDHPEGTGLFEPAGPDAPNELRANQHYYLGRPAIDRIVLTTYPTVRAAWAEMLRDHLDMLFDVGTDALDSLEHSTNISSFPYIRRYQYMLVWNTRKSALRSARVRQALSSAIDRDAIVREALNGHGIASSGPIWPHHWALGPQFDKVAFDPARAANVVASLGLHFTCLVPPDYERLALTVKRQLQAVNVVMDVTEMPPDRIFPAMERGEFDAALFDAVSGASVFRPYRWWHSGTANPAGFSSPSVDAALDQIRHSTSDDEYRAGVAAFQHATIEDPPAIFLAWLERARVVSKRFAVPNAEAGRDILSTLRLWKPVADQSPSSRN
jgi:peptide/nickel transport system substrate-binding protein